MIGVSFSWGMPASPWQVLHSSRRSVMSCPWADQVHSRHDRATISRYMSIRSESSHKERAGLGPALAKHPISAREVNPAPTVVPSFSERERDDVVAPLVVELGVAARRDDNVLLPVDRVGRRRRIDAGARPER